MWRLYYESGISDTLNRVFDEYIKYSVFETGYNR